MIKLTDTTILNTEHFIFAQRVQQYTIIFVTYRDEPINIIDHDESIWNALCKLTSNTI